MRRSSDEDLCLMRAHDMEEGSSHSDLSTSEDHHSEEVSVANSLVPFYLVFAHKQTFLPVATFIYLFYTIV